MMVTRLSRNENTGTWSVSTTIRNHDHSVKAQCGWPDNNEETEFTHWLTAEQAIARIIEIVTSIEEQACSPIKSRA
jgi:hypothetical protein